jgi:spore maturation protein CgeB
MFQQDQPPERLDRLRAPMIRFLGELTVLKAEEFEPHLVLALAQAPLDRRALGELKALGCRTAFWFVEDFRLMVYFREVAAFYDHFFHIQGQELAQELERLGANQAYLPVAAHPPVHRPLELTELERRRYGAEVGFIGAGYANRRRIFTELVQKGLGLRLWGVDWPKEGPLAACLAERMRYLDSDEVVKIYNACSVVINLHSSPLEGQRIGGADFVNPRALEVPACGGFQLVDAVAGLKEFLAPGSEVATFDSQEDLLDKVAHYSKHPGQRAALVQAGRRRVLAGPRPRHRRARRPGLAAGQRVPIGLGTDAEPLGRPRGLMY